MKNVESYKNLFVSGCVSFFLCSACQLGVGETFWRWPCAIFDVGCQRVLCESFSLETIFITII